jgi:hypothetical protein
MPGQRMDYTIDNNAKLFDELLAVLNKHREEPGVAAAFENLKAAKFNYLQRSLDHMMSCLVLTLYDVISQPLNNELQSDLKSVIHDYVTWIFQAGERMTSLARQYEESGGKLLSHDEILQEVDERRGTSR